VKNLRRIEWNPKELGKDERAYLRGQVKLLERLGVLKPAPLFSLELRDRVQDYLASVVQINQGNNSYGSPYPKDVPSSAKQDANALLSLIAGYIES